MRRPAKILLAGTLVAILPCAHATSQTLPSTVYNDQVQLGDVFSDQTLNVVDVTDQTTATSTATGNSADFNVDTGDLDVRSYQTLQADVRASNAVNVAGSSGAVTVLSTAATGNSGDAGVIGGVHTGIYNQATQAGDVNAVSHVEAPAGRTGDVSSSVQAIGNSQGLAATSSAVGVAVNQVNSATVNADGGGTYGYVSGTASFSAVAAANNVTSTGLGAAQRIVVNQRNDAAITQASQFTSYGNAYVASTQATATGNNLTANEQGALLDVTTGQENLAYLRAEAVNSGYEFGSGSATAYGVGNSMIAGNAGTATIIDNVQINDGGGIDVVANYTGTQGYDAASSASAIGNAATGYACSDCAGYMTVANRQTNSAEVGASSTTTATSGRSAIGAASAVGNTASYYVSRPSY